MSELRPPTRWLDDAAGAPDSFAEAARGFREDVPSAAVRQRMWDMLEHNLAVQLMPRAWRMPWHGVSALLLVGTGALLAMRGPERSARVPREEDNVEVFVPAQGSQSVRSAEPVVVAPLPSAQSAAEGGVGAPADLVALPKPKPGAKALKPRKPAAPAAVQQPMAADEVALLVRARRSLHAQPERALALTAQHSEAHPNGVFTEERELLAIEALHLLGRNELLSQRIATFLATYPGSAHRRRIEALRGYE